MRIKKLIVVLLLILLTGYIYTQAEAQPKNSEDSEQQVAKKDKETPDSKEPFFKALLKDTGTILTSPFRIKGKDFLIWGGISLVTGILIANDEKIYRDIKSFQEKNPWVTDVSPVVTLLGDGNVNIGIAGLFYFTGLIFKDKKAMDTGKLTLMSLVHVGVVVQLLKHLTGRARPEAYQGEDKWEGPGAFFKRYNDSRDMFYDSFPSGHTITAWSVATVIAKMYNKNIIVPILSYSLATLAGLSRLTEDKHWLSDIFVGAVLGYAISSFVVRKRSSRVLILPILNNDQVGFSLNYVF